MSLFDKWCDLDSKQTKRKSLWKLTEKNNGRKTVRTQLCSTIRSHYDHLNRISDDIANLGYKAAARILRERLPKTKKARSGDIGEILASELVEEALDFKVPVRRMRYKDGREMPLRGDDFIGVRYSEADGLRLLKGEAKSRGVLGQTTITEARKSLNRDDGRCTPASLLFVADRLLDRDGNDAEVGRVLRQEVAMKVLGPSRIDHVLFTLSGNAPPSALQTDLDEADGGRNHTVVNIRIQDHQEFIADIYKGAGNIGDD